MREDAAQGDRSGRSQLHSAQQLARETLESDHLALESDARIAFRAVSGS